MVLPEYFVIRDTREKIGFGWDFPKQLNTKKPPRCNGTLIQKLNTGDYSIVGYEDILCIERKDDYSEIWTNYSSRVTFENEMERMTVFKYRYVLIESILTKETMDLSPCQFTRSVPGKAVVSWLISLSIKYDVHIVPVGSCGQQYAQLIFQNVIKKEKSRWAIQNE
jgi:hypothetical protein